MSARDALVRVDSNAHKNMFKTLVLLSAEIAGETVYLVVEGCAEFAPLDQVNEGNRYFYEEHTCPTNFLGVEAVMTADDDDPHGIFMHVETVWMPPDYEAARDECQEGEFCRRLFKAFNAKALSP